MEDPRCCGTGTCIINAEGYCWCGQRWDGEKMCFPKIDSHEGAPEALRSVPREVSEQVSQQVPNDEPQDAP